MKIESCRHGGEKQEKSLVADTNIFSPDPAIRAAGTELRLIDLSAEAGSLLLAASVCRCWGTSHWPHAN
jgi:hypothetical protein